MADAEERVVLEGQDAIDIWQQGADAWNAWVAENPVADILFSGIDFTKFETVSFEEFHFPKGNKDFAGASFGDHFVSFSKAVFGDGT